MLRTWTVPVWKVAILFGLLVLAAFAVYVETSSSGSPSGPTLLTGPNGVSEGAARIHQGDTVTIGGMMACLSETGWVKVDSVTAGSATGLQVTGFGIRPNPAWISSPTTGRGELGVSRHALAQLKFPTSRVVNTRCEKGSAKAVEFGVEVRKTTSGEAGVSSFRFTYTSGGDTKTLTFPFAVRLCNEDKAWAKKCKALKV